MFNPIDRLVFASILELLVVIVHVFSSDSALHDCYSFFSYVFEMKKVNQYIL